MTDEFVNTTLQISSPGGTQAQSAKSSVVSMFRFSYKDYLMLLTYISICVNDEAVLVRTADVLQKNVQHAATAGDFKHSAQTEESKFLMSKAYTYISISATADLDMFFMDFDIFSSQVEEAPQENTAGAENSEGETEATEKDGSGTTINYKGLLGY